MLRRWSLFLHRWVGLIAGLPIAVIGLTGSLLVYRGALDRAVHPNLYEVSAPAEEAAVTPGEALAETRWENPAPDPVTIQLPTETDAPYVIWHEAAHGAEKTYVDPATGRVLGVRPAGSDPVRFLFDLHAYLLAGDTGLIVVGVLGLLLLFASATGMVVWWPRAGTWLRAVSVRLRGNSRRLNYDLHRAGGFWTMAYVALLALTGSGLVFYGTAGDLLNDVTDSSSPPPPPASAEPPEGGDRDTAGGPIPAARIDSAWSTLRRRAPEGEVTFISLPSAPRDPLTLRFRLPPELHPVGRSFAYADRWSGELMRVDRQPEMDAGPRLLHALYPLHIGDFEVGPIPPEVVRLVWALLGAAPAVLVVTGVLVWYRRGGEAETVQARMAAGDEGPSSPELEGESRT